MTFTQQQLQQVKEYAGLLLTYHEIALLIDAPISQFVAQVTEPGNPLYLAYQKGRLETEIEIRRQIIENAKMGSPAAQEHALRIIKDTNINNSEHE